MTSPVCKLQTNCGVTANRQKTQELL